MTPAHLIPLGQNGRLEGREGAVSIQVEARNHDGPLIQFRKGTRAV